MNLLTVDRICKRFGDLRAVDDVSFDLGEGVIFGLLGPNGAGKTTTIRMIMNIIIPDSGRVAILGDTNPGTANDHVGYLPEERGMYRKMKVGALLHFLAELKRMRKAEAGPRIDSWLERMDLMEWKNRKVEELSRGMQQKVQFIGTILNQPRLLILDEPFSGLDPINQNLIKEILLELKAAGTTIIFSTHMLDSAEKLCEEIILINKGKKVLLGRLDRIRKEYGRDNVILDYRGDAGFLKSLKEVKKADDYGNTVEIQMVPGSDPQMILKKAVEKVQIQRFEVKHPSLNDIFIETVGAGEEDDHE